MAATNGNIAKMIEQETFREDLYYRLNTIEFRVPGLAERQDDILPLAQQYIDTYASKYRRGDCRLSDSAARACWVITGRATCAS